MRRIDVAWVCLCVCLLVTTANPTKTDKMPLGLWKKNHLGPRSHVLVVGPDPPGEGAILGVARLGRSSTGLQICPQGIACRGESAASE